MTVEKLSGMSNTQIAEYLTDFKETEVFRRSDPTESGLAQTLEKCVEADPQKFTDNLLPFQGVRALYQSSLLRGFQDAWRDKKDFDWVVLLEFIHQILLSEQFWSEKYEDGLNCRNWVFAAAADLISDRTQDDTHAFDAQLLPLAEKILLILAEKTEPSVFTPTDSSLDALSSDKGKVFSAMVNYALRFACLNDVELEFRWSHSIRANFTKRLDRNVESSLEFSYTLGFYLLDLLSLDERWVVGNINSIFSQQNEDHWQAAFSGCLLSSRYPHMNLYVWLKANGHYRKALNTNFADKEVQGRLVRHICTGWIEDRETLDDKTSLIYQLIHSGNPNLLAGMVYFFSRRADNLSDKVKVKVMPAWRALFEVLSQHSNEVAYQNVLVSLSGWLGLIDKIDAEVLAWVKLSIKYVDRTPQPVNLESFIQALLKNASKTPEEVGEIYLGIPKNVLSRLWPGMPEITQTVKILYSRQHQETADAICNRFGEIGLDFLKELYQEYQR
ncbi:hypothetical protein F4054_04800 [Candidatus Poribacteria bacterium]|nr:hypothetical protein [Candidatus Poribacteria bacterium]MYK21562.1 hypothetical protein [Candidatus Poribacteria bacterium]